MNESQNHTAPCRVSPALARKRQHNRFLCIVLLFLVLGFGLWALLAPDKDFSAQENRKLAQQPAFSWAAVADGSYFSDLQSWYNDQFPLRDTWLSIKLRLETLRGQREAGGVFLGQDGYLLDAPETPTAALADTISAMRAFAGEHSEVPMRMLLVPCAAASQPELLPKNAPVRNQLADIAAVGQSLTGCVSMLTPVFFPAEDAQIYYKTDHHWTSLGAYQAFQSTAGAMNLHPDAYTWTSYLVSNDFEGTLASQSGSHSAKDSISVYAPVENCPYYVYYPDTQVKTATLYAREQLETKDQ